MEEDPSKNPLKHVKFPENFTADDIAHAKTDLDVQASSVGMPTDSLLTMHELMREVSANVHTGTINDHVLGVLHEIKQESERHDLPAEATAAVEYLYSLVGSSVADNEPDVIVSFVLSLGGREGSLYEDAMDYPAGDEIDQDKYIRILENLAPTVEYIATWELLQRQRRVVPTSLFDSLSSSITDMQCYELAEIIDRHFIPKGNR